MCVISPHYPSSEVRLIKRLINPKDICQIVNRELVYPSVHEFRLKVLSHHLSGLRFREDELEQVGTHPLGRQVDKGQVAEAVNREIIFELIFAVIAEAEGRDRVASQNG